MLKSREEQRGKCVKVVWSYWEDERYKSSGKSLALKLVIKAGGNGLEEDGQTW